MTDVFVGVGSNIEPELRVPRALALLAERFGRLRISQAYRCPAVGFAGADFINLVVAFATRDTLQTLHAELQTIEAECGRDRLDRRVSRRMDLDLLLYGDVVMTTERLTLPRADILEYAFVLRPLAELAPERRHPVEKHRYADLWAAFDDPGQPLTPVDLEY